MTRPNEHHDTITAGLRIVAERPNGDGTYSPVDAANATSPGGTISIIAKDRDGNAVLVTNAHVITGLLNSQPAGGDRVYHHEISASRHIATVPQWDIEKPAWVERVGGPGNPNRLDVCYAVLESGVDVKFALHGHDVLHLPGETIEATNVHTHRRIVPGTYNPAVGDKLVFLGRNSGEHEVTVTGLNSTEGVPGFGFQGLVSFSSTVKLIGGDSGAGLYKKVGDQYQLSCIFFTASDDRRTGYAFRASEIVEPLDLTFGNTPPIVQASYKPFGTVRPGQRVHLISEGSRDPDGGDLTYLWEFDGAQAELERLGLVINNSASEVANFIAPAHATTLNFKLTVTDVLGEKASDTVTVKVTPARLTIEPTPAYGGPVDRGETDPPDEPPPPPPPLEGCVDTGKVRKPVDGEWIHTGRIQQDPVDDSWEKEESRTVTWEKEQRCTAEGGSVTMQWVKDSRVETRWVALTPPKPTDPPPRPPSPRQPVVTHDWTFDSFEGCGPARKRIEACANGHPRHTRSQSAPEPLVWTYTDAVPGETRNRTEGRWAYTGREQIDPVDDVLEREQSRSVSWQVKQNKESQCGDVEVHWADRSTRKTRWVRESWGSWGDTNALPLITSRGNWRDTSTTRGSLGGRERRQVQDVYRQKEQERFSNFGNRQTRWVDAPSGVDSQWVSDPEPKVWGRWGDTGRTRISSYGSWRNTSTTRGTLGSRRRRQVRTISRQKEQTRRCNYGEPETRWIHHSSSEGYQWVLDPEPKVWGDWKDTGRRRENIVTLIVEKEQKRTSNYGDSQSRWIIA